MHRRTISLIVGAAVLIGSIGLATPSAHADATVVPDPNFAACLNGYLGQPATADITAAQLTGLNMSVSCNFDAISSIEGAQYLTGIEVLYFTDNQISDLTPLAGLTSLTWLGLVINEISDLAPLAGLTSLTHLALSSNEISDLAPLAGLTNLTWLALDSNEVSDLAPLTSLTNLENLYLTDNQISDLAPLAGLTSLTDVWLYDNQISDLAPLAGLTSLTELWLYNNQVSDLAPLAGLTSLTELFLYDNQISDLTPLAGLTGLTYLDLDNNQASDLTPLAGLTGLDVLYANGQVTALPQTTVGTSASPITSLSSMPLTLTVASGPAVVNADGTVTYTGTGTVKFSWTSANCPAPATIGCFSGTATQTVTVFSSIRSSGDDRYGTAAAITMGWWHATTVYLAYGQNFPDALAGASLAAADGSPILLTGTTSAPDATMDRLEALDAKTVVLLGGTSVIAPAVQAQLEKAGYQVQRIAGADRYETAALIGAQVLVKSKATTAVVATGTGFADAVSISPVAGMEGWPVVFATATDLPQATSDFIKANKITSVVIVGGTSAVGTGVEAQLKDLGVTTVTRVSGADRYATSGQVATTYKSLFGANVSVATGTEFADALTGGVFSATLKMPMLLLDPKVGADPAEKAYAKGLPDDPTIFVYGGTTALPDAAVRTLLY